MYLCQKSPLKPKFDVELMPEAVLFLENLDSKSREKIYYNIKKSQYLSDRELFKKLNDFIWEFRTLYNGRAYRLFAFWDRTGGNDTLVIATHGILKKTQKTPVKEIKKAEDLRKEYFKGRIQ